MLVRRFKEILSLLIVVLASTLLSCGEKVPLPKAQSTTTFKNLSLTQPSMNPYTSADSDLTISGTCNEGSVINMSGDDNQTVACQSGQFSFNIIKNTNGTYVFNLAQVNSDQSVSPTVSFSWIRSLSIPNVSIVSPPVSPYSSNASSLIIAGGCENGYTVYVTGSDSKSSACVASAFSISISKSNDATYSYSVYQANSNGESSASQNLSWIRDTVAPTAPTLVSPASNPFASSSNSLAISGACESGAVVNLSGDDSQTAACPSGTYSFNVSKATAGTYNFVIKQTDLAGNISTARNLQWIYSTTVTPVPTISIPVSPIISTNLSSITISGTCVNMMRVNLGGDVVASDVTAPSGALTQICSNSSYSFTIGKTTDATYNFTLSQTNLTTSITSSSVGQQWIRDTLAPTAVLIQNPSTNPFISAGILVLSGTCENNATIYLTGDDSQSVLCASANFSFNIVKSIDGTYNFSVLQTDVAGNSSNSVSQQWIRNSVPPSTPTITNPASNPYYFKTNSFIVSGACTTGLTVTMSGVSASQVTSPVNSLTQVCAGNAYSFTVGQTIDTTLNMSIKQTSAAGVDSSSVTRQIIRDTVAPSTPSISVPSTSPFISSGNSLVISGTCENAATVSLSGDDTQSLTCASGSFSFTINKSSDATYSFSIQQMDLAGNTSSAASQQWIRDTGAPNAPTITTPASNPFYSNLSTLTISGVCEIGATVNLSGSDSQSVVCSSGAYSFTVNKTSDATYNFSLTQTDGVGNVSTASTLQWVRDTVAPSAPTVTTPAANPYSSNGSSITISGACVSGNTVNLSGSSTQNTSCSSNAYSFTVSKSTDATYNFTVTQTDLAGNVSSGTSQQWIRDTVAPNAVTITNPASSPFYSNTNSIVVSGACVTGSNVVMTGSSSQNMTCASSAYSFTINKSSDATYTFSITQTDAAGNTSAAVTQQWIRDTVAPIITLSAQPPSSNPAGASANFTFSANESASFECQLDAGGWSACSSPKSYSGLAAGAHTVYIRATDLAGNLGNMSPNATWTQLPNTVALYHFDTSPGTTVDSGGYSGANAITTNSTSSTTGKFNQGQNLNGSTNYMSLAHTTSMAQLLSTMTIEGFFKHSSLPSNGSKQAFIGKMGSAGQMGWEFGIKRTGSSYYLYFVGSLDGTTSTEITSTAFASPSTSSYHHYAVTWNAGTVTFYFDGAAQGTGVIGTAGSSVLYNNSSTNLDIGRSNATNYYNGIIDEVRLSAVVRWSAAFTVPSAAYTSD